MEDPLIERVRRLQALAGNNPNENEAAAAATKAQELMWEHNISQALIDAAEKDSTKPKLMEFTEARYSCNVGEANGWRVTVADAVASGVGGELLYIDNYRDIYKERVNGYLIIITPKDVLESTMETIRFLDESITRLSKFEAKNRERDFFGEYLENGRTWRTSWLRGCAMRVSERIREASRDNRASREADDGNSKALVVIETAKDAYMEKAHPKVSKRSRSNRSGFSHDGFNAGRESGSNIDLGQGKVSAGRVGIAGGK